MMTGASSIQQRDGPSASGLPPLFSAGGAADASAGPAQALLPRAVETIEQENRPVCCLSASMHADCIAPKNVTSASKRLASSRQAARHGRHRPSTAAAQRSDQAHESLATLRLDRAAHPHQSPEIRRGWARVDHVDRCRQRHAMQSPAGHVLAKIPANGPTKRSAGENTLSSPGRPGRSRHVGPMRDDVKFGRQGGNSTDPRRNRPGRREDRVGGEQTPPCRREMPRPSPPTERGTTHPGRAHQAFPRAREDLDFIAGMTQARHDGGCPCGDAASLRRIVIGEDHPGTACQTSSTVCAMQRWLPVQHRDARCSVRATSAPVRAPGRRRNHPPCALGQTEQPGTPQAPAIKPRVGGNHTARARQAAQRLIEAIFREGSEPGIRSLIRWTSEPFRSPEHHRPPTESPAEQTLLDHRLMRVDAPGTGARTSRLRWDTNHTGGAGVQPQASPYSSGTGARRHGVRSADA